MRTISTAQNEVLNRGKYQVAIRVEIEDSTSTLVDVSDFEGQNWIKSVEISDSVDSAVVMCRVNLFARRYDLSMHPLDEESKINLPSGSYAPFLDIRRQVRVLTATVPQNYTPVTSDFELVFDGFIDVIPETGKQANDIVLDCRDKGGELQDTWIEDMERYGDGSVDNTNHVFADLEDILQEILDNWAAGTTLFSENGTGGTPFLPGDTPGFNVEAWDVDIQSVLDALRIGANSIGWECRYRFQTNTNEYELQLYEPDRASASVERTFGPTNYIDITSLELDVSRIRNVIEVTFYTDPEDDQTKTTIQVVDAASVTRYGRRWFGIVEAQTSAINTSAEANRLANAVLADLREPDRDQNVDMHYFWATQLGDRYTFLPNGVNYTTSQTWAVVGYRHVLSEGQQRTTLTTRRAPSGGIDHWWDRGQIGGIAALLKDKSPAAPTVSVDVLDHGILVGWTKSLIRRGQVGYYEVHASTTALFSPSPSTLIARTRGTRHRAMGLDQETTYFFKILAVDREGNVSSNSNEASSIPGYLRGFPGRIETTFPSPASLQPGQMVFLQDGSFGQRKYKTYVERLNDLFTATPIFNLGLDETSGTNVVDDSGNGNDFTFINVAGITLAEPPGVEDGGTAVLFSDNSSIAGHARLLGLNQTGIDKFTFSTWVKFPATKPSHATTLIDVRDAGGGLEFEIQWEQSVSGDDLEITINGTLAGPSGKKVVDAVELEERSWFMLTVTWDNTAGDIKVYINDVEVDSFTGIETSTTLTFDDFHIGSTSIGVLGLDGRLDRPTMWINEVATLAQVSEVFYHGRSVNTDVDESRVESGGGIGVDQSRHVPFFIVELITDITYSLSGWVNSAFGRVLADPWQMFDKNILTTITAATQGSAPVTIPQGWEGYWEFGVRIQFSDIAANNYIIAAIAIDSLGGGFPGGAAGNPQHWGSYAQVTPSGPMAQIAVTPPVFMAAGGQAKPKHFSQSDASYQLDRATTDAVLCHFWGRYLFQKRNLNRGNA